MADIVSSEVRSRMMARVRGKNTKPELMIRSGLYAEGFRYRLHMAELPGKPDLTLPRYSAVIQVHGCFWHGHDCILFKLPTTRKDFWRTKISRNKERDLKNEELLAGLGWRTGIVWECALKGKSRLPPNLVIDHCAKWLKSNRKRFELKGHNCCGAFAEKHVERCLADT